MTKKKTLEENPVIKEKTYTISWIVRKDNTTTLNRKCDGFHAVELLGILELIRSEIIQQIQGNIKPDVIERQVVKPITK